MKQLVGLLVLNKPQGETSRAALDRVTALAPRVKMGHAGTLDPMATGVLVVCVGKATRLIPYVQRMPKEYRAGLRLGVRSVTHDLESSLEDAGFTSAVEPGAFESSLAPFRGEIEQVPPQHSAVHVAGRRAYELARAGKTVELAARTVRVDRLECTRFEFPNAELEITCSSGTYVRSLVRDIGERLGCGAVMSRLERSAIGSFRLEQAVSPNELTAARLDGLLRPAIDAVGDLPRVVVRDRERRDIEHGRTIAVPRELAGAAADVALVSDTGELLAVAELDRASRQLRPRVVLMDAAN